MTDGNFSNYKRGILNVNQYNKDVSFGMKSEKSVFDILVNEYGDKIHKTKDKYAKMDYYLLDDNDKIIKWFELKSRRVNFGRYPSLCFNKSKLDFAMKQKVPTTILFNCLDGLYKWEFNNNTMETNSDSHEYFLGDIANCNRNDKINEAVFVYNKYITAF